MKFQIVLLAIIAVLIMVIVYLYAIHTKNKQDTQSRKNALSLSRKKIDSEWNPLPQVSTSNTYSQRFDEIVKIISETKEKMQATVFPIMIMTEVAAGCHTVDGEIIMFMAWAMRDGSTSTALSFLIRQIDLIRAENLAADHWGLMIIAEYANALKRATTISIISLAIVVGWIISGKSLTRLGEIRRAGKYLEQFFEIMGGKALSEKIGEEEAREEAQKRISACKHILFRHLPNTSVWEEIFEKMNDENLIAEMSAE